MDNSLVAAGQMIENRIKKSTKRMYAGYIRKFKNWGVQNGLQIVEDDGELILPIDTDILMRFFSFIGNNGIHVNDGGQLTDINNNAVTREEEGKATKATTTVGAVRSAFKDYYKMRLMRMPEAQETKLTSFIAGFKRSVAQLKLEGYMDVREGRSPISFPGYKALANAILRGCPINRSSHWLQYIMPWPFHILCWNLIARSCSVGDLMLQHLRWKNDCLTIVLPKHKRDQGGDQVFDRHVYANPLQPSICPILSLAVYTFCKPFRNPSDRMLSFDGTRCEKQFSDLLATTVQGLSEGEKMLLGARPEDIGTHSYRKGASTYALSVVGGPHPVTVYIRAGWSLGTVKDRYIHSGEGNDQLAGRVLAGLPITDDGFGALPPHFASPELSMDWDEIMPSYANYPESFQTCIPFLLASLVYHQDWLRSHLHQSHPLFSQRVFTSGSLERLKPSVIAGYGVDETFGMMATGIPHHILLAEKIRSVEYEMKHGVKRQIQDMNECIHSRLDELPSKLSTTLRSEFSIRGVVSITRRDVEDIVASLRQDINQLNVPREAPTIETPVVQQETFQHFCWGERFHPVPEDFQFPQPLDVKTIWDLWWYGDISKRIRPYHFIKAFDLQTKVESSALSKARKVISRIEQVGRTEPGGKVVSQMTKTESDEFFTRSFLLLTAELGRSHQVAIGELSYITVYDLIQRHGRMQA